MSRTRKSLLKQNLDKVPVFLYDTGTESIYFNIKQLSSTLTGGKNSFLISGTGLLQPNTEILIEMLDVNGNSIFVEAIKNFSEAGARLVVVEVYENTPKGAAILTILGTASVSSDGTPIPYEWTGVTNTKWQKRVIIEPRNRNITPIRIKTQPEIITSELILTGSYLTQTDVSNSINYSLRPKLVSGQQKGYVITNNSATPFASYQLTPVITGSLSIETRQYTDTIPPSSPTYEIIGSDYAAVDLPLVLTNASRSFTDTNIISSVDSSIINIPTILTSNYTITQSAYSSSTTQYIHVVSIITSSVQYIFANESIQLTTDRLSYAKLRIINLDSVSGEIFRIKTSNKSAGSQTDFLVVSDSPAVVGEILITGSSNLSEKEHPIGQFNTQGGIYQPLDLLTSNWYSYLITGSNDIPDASYETASISSSFFFNLKQSDEKMLDAGYSCTTSSSYFFGTIYPVAVFPTSEYTLTFDSFVYTTSGSTSFNTTPYTVDVYAIGTSIVGNGPLGQKLGTISTDKRVAYFPQQAFNFTVPLSGSISIRFVVTSGFWQFANISLKVAQEFAFNPSEVTLTIPNRNFVNTTVLYKTNFFDLNNNALNLETISEPTYFIGTTNTGTTALIDTYTFIGNGSTQNYLVSSSYDSSSLFISVAGLVASSGFDYTVSGSTVHFLDAPPSGSNILIKAFNL